MFQSIIFYPYLIPSRLSAVRYRIWVEELDFASAFRFECPSLALDLCMEKGGVGVVYPSFSTHIKSLKGLCAVRHMIWVEE